MTLTETEISDITTSIKNELTSSIIFLNKQISLLYQIVKLNGLDKNNNLLVTNHNKIVDNINLQVEQNYVNKTTKLTRV